VNSARYLLVLALLVAHSLVPTRAQAAIQLPQRVRVGSTASFVDTAANVWSADRAYAPGSFGYTTGDAYTSGATIANTPDGPLFQAYRHATAFGYRFDVPNGA
jgi:hypothetical protein